MRIIEESIISHAVPAAAVFSFIQRRFYSHAETLRRKGLGLGAGRLVGFNGFLRGFWS